MADLFFTRSPVLAAWGAGVDSTAMLIEMVTRGEPVDAVLFADVGSERPETYEFVPIFRKWLDEHGIRNEIVRYEPTDYKHWPPYRTLEENCLTNGTLPSKAFGFGSCSMKWKVEPQNRWAKKWQPAIDAWAAGEKVIKLIGYDCSPADQRRYADREGYDDPRYHYRYPLREFGWKREDCIARIERSGLPVPPKSACFFCPAMKPYELHTMPKPLLRRIVLMEARAKPRLQNIDGLWRKPIKGLRGATPKPGSMTEYIREQELLPADEVDQIIALAPAHLMAFQDAVKDTPVERRPDLKRWIELFDLGEDGWLSTGPKPDFYAGVSNPQAESEAA